MNPDDIAAELPAPRDDEPESLRRDIVDELADHLQCSLQRELLASPRRRSGDSGSEHTARQQALTRFGNPASIARRLWFDAMKERIMAQKTMAAALVLAAVALCVMTAMTWSRSRVDRQFLLETFAANREMMEQMSRLQELILQDSRASQQALKSLVETDVSNPEWVRGEVLVKLDSVDGPPAEGVEVEISPTGNRPAIMGTKALTDANGRADLGLLQIGSYYITMRSAAGEHMLKHVSVYPGKPFSDVIVMPSGPNEPVDVTVGVDWPGEFDPEDTWIVLWQRSFVRDVAGESWGAPFEPPPSELPYQQSIYAISPEGTVYDVASLQQQQQPDVGSGCITWSPEDAREVKTLTLPDRSYRFHQVSFVVDSTMFAVEDWANNGLPTRIYVSTLMGGPKYQELSDGPDPVLTINVPDSVPDDIAEFHEQERNPEKHGSALPGGGGGFF